MYISGSLPSVRPSSNVESSVRRIKSFDSTHGRFGPVEFNIWADPNQLRRIQLIQTSNLPCAESNA